MARERDPLSVAYDGAAALALRKAIRARPGTYTTFVYSPGRASFSSVDPGGRTRHERAFTRSLYYIVVQVPRRESARTGRYVPQQWSLVLRWGKIENRGGRYGRRVKLKMVTAKSGYQHVSRHPQAGLKPTGSGY